MEKFDLGGEWNIYSADKKYKLKGDVPGSLLYELEKSGVYGNKDVFYRDNNRKCLEIINRDFIFTKSFIIKPDFLKKSKKIFLEADGLDTLTEITVNRQLIAKTFNMHRRYRLEISKALKIGKNNIRIKFFNTLKYIKDKGENKNFWVVGCTLKDANHIRKSHCSYGWDWGPEIPDAGIWRNICLKAYSGAKINNIHIVQKHKKNKVSLVINSDIEKWTNEDISIKTIVTAPGGIKKESISFLKNLKKSSLQIDIANPQLWWPNGYGPQSLYHLRFELIKNSEVIDFRDKNIGLRQLTLKRKKDRWGESFQFTINNVDIFARGANYIPEDVYLSRPTPEKTEKLIRDCVQANYNFIRVWGGGIYPSDNFFDLCDKYGLIVWQDMMFANAMYDIGDKGFYNNIKEEVKDNLRRIRHHACVGLICGNNEIEGCFASLDEQIITKQSRLDYLRQYESLFPKIVKKLCPEIPYWPSSSSSGGGFKNFNNPDKGDAHCWEVWHANKPFTEYEKYLFRFVSEFGLQSFPSIKTISSFAEKKDLNIFSPVMEDHQRNTAGNMKIFDYISQYFRFPKNFVSLLYLSQLIQAEGMRYGIEHWRRNRGRCMGALYWQLNDNWPVASWSSLDYFGRWKALHYIIKRVFNQVLLSCKTEGMNANIYLSNEYARPVSGKFVWSLLSLGGGIIKSGSKKVTINKFLSKKIENISLKNELKNNLAREHYLSYFFTEKSGEVFRGTTVFCPYKSINFINPEISRKIYEDNKMIFIEVHSKAFAKFVELDLKKKDANFSDNYFDLNANEKRIICIDKKYNNVTVKDIKKELLIKSLYDSYNV
jgi:beta-mannosidase